MQETKIHISVDSWVGSYASSQVQFETWMHLFSSFGKISFVPGEVYPKLLKAFHSLEVLSHRSTRELNVSCKNGTGWAFGLDL